MIIIFDTETTGLFPGQICQLSYIMIDEKERRTKNFYFTVEHMEDSATAVNHLTVESLYSLSKGRLFRTTRRKFTMISAPPICL